LKKVSSPKSPTPFFFLATYPTRPKKSAREAIAKRKAGSLIPPPKNGRYKGDGSERDKALLEIRGLGGDKHAKSIWGKLIGYSRRVFVEAFFLGLNDYFGKGFIRKHLKDKELKVG